MASYASTARPFDALAPRYDEMVESNPLHAYMRARSVAWLDEAFRPGMRVLEIGCGAGHEAVHLGHRGVRVTATDISGRMVGVARARVRAEGLGHIIRVEQCTLPEIGRIAPADPFDGAYASLGALNCVPDLASATRDIAERIRPGGDFLSSVVSRPSLPETVLGAAQFRFPKALRRMGHKMTADLYGLGTVEASAYSETEFRRALAPSFTIERLEGWLVAMPPPSAAATWSRLRLLHRPIEAIEAKVRTRWPFRGWGDHLHVWARRRLP